MERRILEELILSVKNGDLSVDECLERLKHLPMEDLGFACVDHHRPLRRGYAEVIYGEGKDKSQIVAIMKSMVERGEDVLITRISQEKADAVRNAFPAAEHHLAARAVTMRLKPFVDRGRGRILVLCAGTSDIPVAEEAAVTARFMGNSVDTVYDVGVAGLHRLLAHREKIAGASVIVVAAGMEGALPSVVGGLVDKPVIAVPTSVGYGAGSGGFAALFAMLNSCASGVVVVNIDNGFGAGYAASLINRA